MITENTIMKKMEIYGWGAPRPTKENLTNYLNAGFNTLLLDTWGERYGSIAVENAFKLCDEVGLDCIPFAHQDGDFFNFPSKDDSTQYLEFKSYKGAFMTDEPDGESLVYRLSNWIEEFERKNPGKQFRFNMSCGYTGPKFLKPEIKDSYQRVRITYDWICSLTLDKLSGEKIFSIDYYPFQEEEGQNILQHDYLFPLEYAAILSKSRGYDFHLYIQSSGGWTDGYGSAREIVSIKDIRFQVLCAMAYGVRGIGYFLYTTNDAYRYKALVEHDGTLNEKYYFAKQVNKEIHNIEEVYLSFDWNKSGLLLSNTPKSYALNTKKRMIASCDKFDGFTTIENTGDLLVGEFTGKDNKIAYWLVNYAEPSEKSINNIKVEIKKGVRLISTYKNGNEISLGNIEERCLFDLAEGEGVFMVMEKAK